MDHKTAAELRRSTTCADCLDVIEWPYCVKRYPSTPDYRLSGLTVECLCQPCSELRIARRDTGAHPTVQ